MVVEYVAGIRTLDLMFPSDLPSDLLESLHQFNGFGIIFKGTGSS